MNSIARATGFASHISATVQCLPSSNRKSIVELAKKAEKILLEPRPAVNGNYRLTKAYLSPSGCVNQRATVGLTCKLQCSRTSKEAGLTKIWRDDGWRWSSLLDDRTGESTRGRLEQSVHSGIALFLSCLKFNESDRHVWIVQMNCMCEFSLSTGKQMRRDAVKHGRRVGGSLLHFLQPQWTRQRQWCSMTVSLYVTVSRHPIIF